MTTFFDVTSVDGTVLRGWCNGSDGLPLVVSNGLGTIPQAWPALLASDSGYRAVSWYYCGTFGSQRPADPARIRVVDHVEDMLALMDHQGIERGLVACWSIGVNIAFEFVQRHPDRVAGLLAVAGVPGGTFATMGGPWRIPLRLRKPIATTVAKGAHRLGGPLTWAAHRLPVDERVAWLLTHSGLMRQAARPESSCRCCRSSSGRTGAGTCGSPWRRASTPRWTCPSSAARPRSWQVATTCSPRSTT